MMERRRARAASGSPIQTCRRRLDLDGLVLFGADGHRGRARVLPGAVALPDAVRRADERLPVDPLVGDGVGRLLLAPGEIQLLYPICGFAEAAPDHHVLVEILVAMPHAADVERDLGLQLAQGGADILVHLDMDGCGDLEVRQRLATAGAPEALPQPGATRAEERR